MAGAGGDGDPVLTSLGTALAGWQPAGGGPRDPLVAIRAAWAGIVGEEIARAAQPASLADGALVVVTTSSGWSHQLAFLEPRILDALAALPEGRGIARLRFRIGRPRTPAAPGRPRAVRRAVPSPPRPAGAAAAPAASVPEAIARMRRAVERRRARHLAAGGGFCATCSAAIDAGGQCVPCRDAERSRRRADAERILFEMPWLAPEEVVALVPGLDAAAYDTIRRDLLRGWLDALRLGRARAGARAPIDRTRLRKLASSYVLLDARVDPSRTDLEPVRRNSLGDLYEFVVALETGSIPPPRAPGGPASPKPRI